jgi:hypothetical protein
VNRKDDEGKPSANGQISQGDLVVEAK